MSMNKWRALISLLMGLLVVLIFDGCAKKPAIIKGTVVDDKGKPLGGAAIMSVPQRYNTLTDTLGNFEFESVEPAQYSLLVKFGADSVLVNIGLVEPGEVKAASIVLTIAPPPPPPPEPKIDTVAKPIVETPPKEIKFVDPIIKEGGNVLLLCSEEYFAKYEIESSDGLNWEKKKTKNQTLKFKGETGRLVEGYFAGPNRDNQETGAGRLIYDGRLWIYGHGPQIDPKTGRTISISVPLDISENTNMDSVVLFYGIPPYAKESDDRAGSIQLRVIGENAGGKVSVLMDWLRLDHSTNGSLFKKVVALPAENRRLTYLTLEFDSDGDNEDDDILMRPLIYYSLQ